MSDQNVKFWQETKKSRELAERWNNLPNGPKYQNNHDSFAISIAHCKPPQLVRAGQQSCGGKNYWETDEKFSKAILEYLVNNWNSVYPEVMEIMKAKERKALLDCQEYVTNLQNLINGAEEK